MTYKYGKLYVMAKLTLHVPEELVTAAKLEAASRHVSVSKLVTDFFRNLAARKQGEQPDTDIDLAPRTQRLSFNWPIILSVGLAILLSVLSTENIILLTSAPSASRAKPRGAGCKPGR